jgi:putative Mn2+ efflux pump MntP
MDIALVLVIGLGVSLDCFAVAIAGSISMRSISVPQAVRASLAFGVFQAAMLALGWLAGNSMVDLIGRFDHWVAFGLLSLVGGKMLWEARKADDDREQGDITRGLPLLILSIATSIDSLAVGLTLGFLESSILIAALIIGSVTFLVSAAGFYAGAKVGPLLGRWAEVLGGLVLIGIGVRILVAHTA